MSEGSDSEGREADGGDAAGRDAAEFRDAVRRGYDVVAEAYRASRTATDGETDVPLLDDLMADLPVDALVLDAGCGSGVPVGARLSRRFRVVGLDASREQLRLAGDEVPAMGRMQGDLTALPFADDAFDALVAFHSVIHVPREQHAETFAEFERVLRPDAPAVVTSGSGDWEGSNPDWLDAGAEMRWSFHGSDETRALLGEAGFAIEDETVVEDSLGGGSFTYYRLRA